MTLKDHKALWNGMFQAKRCEIGPKLLLIINRKWLTPCQIRWKLLTLMILKVTDNQYGRLS